MNLSEIDWRRALETVTEEASLIQATIKDKGARHFMRPLGVAVALVGGSFLLVYKPSKQSVARLDRKLAEVRSTAQFAAPFKENQDRLAAIYRDLPAVKDRDQWLSSTLVGALKAQGIISESLRPPLDAEGGGLVFQSVSMTSRLKLEAIYAFLASLEAVRPVVQVSSLEIVKHKEEIGYNQTSCTIFTAIPLRRY